VKQITVHQYKSAREDGKAGGRGPGSCGFPRTNPKAPDQPRTRAASASPVPTLIPLASSAAGSRPPPRLLAHPARSLTMLLHLVTSSSPLAPARPSQQRRTCVAAAAVAVTVRCAASSSSSGTPSSSASETAAAGQRVAKVHSYGAVDYERRPPLRWSTLYRRIAVGHGGRPVGRTLGAWDEGERRLDKWELCRIAKELRKFRRFNLALQVVRSACVVPPTYLFPFGFSQCDCLFMIFSLPNNSADPHLLNYIDWSGLFMNVKPN